MYHKKYFRKEALENKSDLIKKTIPKISFLGKQKFEKNLYQKNVHNKFYQKIFLFKNKKNLKKNFPETKISLIKIFFEKNLSFFYG